MWLPKVNFKNKCYFCNNIYKNGYKILTVTCLLLYQKHGKKEEFWAHSNLVYYRFRSV